MLLAGKSMSGRERNCVYLNTRDGRFANTSAISGVDFPDDGRALVRTDWDGDGDIDLWISNRNAPRVRYLQNDSPAGRHWIQFRLRGDGQSVNRDAIGARVEIVVEGDAEKDHRIRSVRAGDSFLAQSSRILHFGLDTTESIKEIVVSWPGGQVDRHTGVPVDHAYTLKIGKRPQEWDRPGRLLRDFTQEPEAPKTTGYRIPLVTRLPLPKIAIAGEDTSIRLGGGEAVLILLWASWCPVCQSELRDLSRHHNELRAAGLRIVALAVNGLGEDKSSPEDAIAYAGREQFPFPVGVATEALMAYFQNLHDRVVVMNTPLPVPTSFLVDAKGQLTSIYKGRVALKDILADVRRSNSSNAGSLADASFFEGSTIDHPVAHAASRRIALGRLRGFAVRQANEGQLKNSEEILTGIVRTDPNSAGARFALANVLLKQKRPRVALTHLRHALKLRPDYSDAQYSIGVAFAIMSKPDQAERAYRATIAMDPKFVPAHLALGRTAELAGHNTQAIAHFKNALSYGANLDAAVSFATALLKSKTPSRANLEIAEKAIRNALVLSPDRAEAFHALAAVLANMGRFEEAVAAQSKALATVPEHARTRYETQLALFMNGKTR